MPNGKATVGFDRFRASIDRLGEVVEELTTVHWLCTLNHVRKPATEPHSS